MERNWSTTDNELIRAACREVASNQSDRRGRGQLVDVASLDVLTEKLFKVAMEAVACSVVDDPAIAARAIRYLAHTHAIPQMRDDTSWFWEALRVLFELACPNSGQGKETDAFFQDIERGIADSRAGFDD